MSDRLREIIHQAQKELAEKSRRVRIEDLEKEAGRMPPAKDFREAINHAGQIKIIAEIKRKSPSAGNLRPHLIPEGLAKEYTEAGASALSVLTNNFFGGSLEDLLNVRSAVDIPILRKDLTLDPFHIYEARRYGADAVLLILSILTDEQLGSFTKLAQNLGMAALVEVHDRKELDRALEWGIKLIGINNRNLRDFSIDLSTTLKLANHVPKDIVLVAESGYKSSAEIRELKGTGVKAVLIGESLLRNENPGEALKALVEAGHAAR
jgi:indole-3-glycerol phosphate synthase